MLDINKARSSNNYNTTKYSTKCEASSAVLLPQKSKQQQHQQQVLSKLSQQQQQQHTHKNTNSAIITTTTTTTTATAKKLNGLQNFVSTSQDLKAAITIKPVQTLNPLVKSNIGFGRGLTIAERINAAKRTPAGVTATAAAAAASTTTTSAASSAITTQTNPVRKANEHFFLLPEFQNKSFLKNECEIAHAQVVATTASTSSPLALGVSASAPATPPTNSPIRRVKSTALSAAAATANGYLAKKQAAENVANVGTGNQKAEQPNNNNSSSSNKNNVLNNINNNNNNGNSNSNNLLMRRGNFSNGNVSTATATQSTKSKTTAATTTATTISTHKNLSSSNNSTASGTKSAPPSASNFKLATSAATAAAASPLTTTITTTAATTTKTSEFFSSKIIKPLVHRPTSTAATTTKTTSTALQGCTIGFENPTFISHFNNNHNNNNNNNNNSTVNFTKLNNNNNNNMTTKTTAATATAAAAAALEQDDIKYIDSDDVAATANSGANGKFVPCLEATTKLPNVTTRTTTPSASSSTTANKDRMRPKTTIFCSSGHHHHHHHHESSGSSNQLFEKVNSYKQTHGSGSSSGGVSVNRTSSNSASPPARRNTPSPYAIDSNSIKASIEKFNSFSEQKRLPLANAVTLRGHTSATGSTSNLQCHRHSGSDFDSRQFQHNSSGNSGGGSLTRNPYRTAAGFSSAAGTAAAGHNSASASLLPLKAKVRVSDGSSLATTSTGKAAAGATATTIRQINSASSEIIANNSAVAAVANDESVSARYQAIKSLTKSVLPPASPTASRYWDRDNVRTSSLSTLSSSGHNNLENDKASHDEKSEGLCGLRNIGNTCFMNSIIQCLSHTSELTKFLRNYNGSKTSSTTKDQQILLEFAKLIREMWTSNVHSVTPMDLKRAFSLKHRMYSDYNQQDAQEFLRFFLDSLHSALNSGVKGEPLKIDDNLSDNRKADLTWEWYARYENSLIRDLFVGQLKSTLRCTACGNASVTFDPFWDLSVSLPSSSRCRLDACLDMFIREEVLDGDEMPTCSKCKTRRKCTKSFSIQRFPKYLVIHLKRFSETRWSKLSSIVEFPTGERELNMGSYGANPNSNIYYSLYAISNHMGSTAGGHYVALCKHPVSRKWHEFNDNMVSDALSESHLVTSSAYILFYERA